MQETWHDYFYDYRQEFPDAVSAWAGSFEQVYFAERVDLFYFIYDGRLAVDFVVACSVSEENLKELMSNPDEMWNKHSIYQDEGIIQIIAFDSADERKAYLQEKYVNSVKTKISFEKKLDHSETNNS